MNNKLKLFYIFIIVVLLGSIFYLTKEMDVRDARFINQNEITNRHISRNYLFYLEIAEKAKRFEIECNDLKLENTRLKHDIEETLKEYNVLVELLKNKALTIQ